ncbi:MAG: hypothetical protein UT02_C0027G0004 [Parcubacteria group bacterium GW2011_GWC2_38_7]|nr:MAG: hypothetical protein UT02_C0027G0004 [Parcubacteria group bacterium GW2011_GWC2_38_7]
MSENIVYQDKVKSSPIVLAVLLLGVVIVVIVGLVMYFQQSLTIDSSALPTLLVVFVADLLILLTFRQMQIVVTDKELRFGFYIFRKRINLKNIESVEIQDFKFTEYMGYGIRYSRNNTVGYVPCGGRGLKIKVKGETRNFFFICNRPEEAQTFIKQYGTQK